MRDDDVDVIVNACDAGREGELIFAYVYETRGEEAGQAPVAVLDDEEGDRRRRSSACATARR